MRLREVAVVDPPTPGFSACDAGAEISFLPLDRVWHDSRFDPSTTVQFDGDTRSYTPVLEGDLLVPKVAPTFARGRVALARGLVAGRALATSEVFVVRTGYTNGARFLQYRLQAVDFLTEGVASWTGVAGLKRISSDFLRDVRIHRDAWCTREHISRFLDRETAGIDELVEARVRQAMLLKERAAAVRDQSIAAAGKPTRLSSALIGIEQGWSPECHARVPDRAEWGVLKAGATNYGMFRELESKALPADLAPRRHFEVRAGDVLMSRANTRELAGSTAFVEQCRPRLMISDKLYRVVPDQTKLQPRYLALVLQSAPVRAQIEAETVGSSGSMQNISQQLVRTLRLPMPSLDDQARIVATCSDSVASTRRTINAIDRQLALLSERRRALITAAVTGGLQVPDRAMADTAA